MAFVVLTVWVVASAGSFGNYWPLWLAPLGAAMLIVFTAIIFAATDILTAAVASTVASLSTIAIYYLAQPSASLRKTGMMLLMVLASMLLYSILTALRGRELSLVLRPEYVRNIADRIAVQAEIETARNAQKSILPKSIPAIQHGSLAARCRAAYEVNGDYYDFFPLHNGRLAIAVADARTGGLHAALSTTMMKGMLLSYIRRHENPKLIVQKLREHLSALFGATLPVSFLFGIFDPEISSIDFARSGASPGVFQLSEGSVLKPIAPMPSSELAIEGGTLAVGKGESLLFMTDGIVAALGANLASDRFDRSGTAEELIERLFRTAEQNAAEAERHDDWTAIVISRKA